MCVGALPDFVFCSLIPVQQISSGIRHYGSFFGLVSNILNVKSNTQKPKSTVINVVPLHFPTTFPETRTAAAAVVVLAQVLPGTSSLCSHLLLSSNICRAPSRTQLVLPCTTKCS